VWNEEKNGEYSICGAYHLCIRELLETFEFKVVGRWNLIWKLKARPKVKILVWRIARNV